MITYCVQSVNTGLQYFLVTDNYLKDSHKLGSVIKGEWLVLNSGAWLDMCNLYPNANKSIPYLVG